MWALAGLETFRNTLHLLSENVFKMNGKGKTTAWCESHPSRDQNHRAGPENQYVRAEGVGAGQTQVEDPGGKRWTLPWVGCELGLQRMSGMWSPKGKRRLLTRARAGESGRAAM